MANSIDGPALARWFLKWLVCDIVQTFVHSSSYRGCCATGQAVSDALAGYRHSHDCSSPSRSK